MLRYVEEIIDSHHVRWDETLIRDVYSPVDAHRILQIPLNVHLVKDFVTWMGTLSVQSTYHEGFEH